MKTNPIENQVVECLKAQGYTSSFEFPGYVSVTSKKSGTIFCAGTVNGEWDVNRDDSDGGSAVPFFRLNIPLTETNAQTIAQAIIKAIES